MDWPVRLPWRGEGAREGGEQSRGHPDLPRSWGKDAWGRHYTCMRQAAPSPGLGLAPASKREKVLGPGRSPQSRIPGWGGGVCLQKENRVALGAHAPCEPPGRPLTPHCTPSPGHTDVGAGVSTLMDKGPNGVWSGNPSAISSVTGRHIRTNTGSCNTHTHTNTHAYTETHTSLQLGAHSPLL